MSPTRTPDSIYPYRAPQPVSTFPVPFDAPMVRGDDPMTDPDFAGILIWD